VSGKNYDLYKDALQNFLDRPSYQTWKNIRQTLKMSPDFTRLCDCLGFPVINPEKGRNCNGCPLYNKRLNENSNNTGGDECDWLFTSGSSKNYTYEILLGHWKTHQGLILLQITQYMAGLEEKENAQVL
jgi:hypothetical protein